MSFFLRKLSGLHKKKSRRDVGEQLDDGTTEKTSQFQEVYSLEEDQLHEKNRRFQIAREKLVIKNLLGSGCFGKVHLATLEMSNADEESLKVAVKKFRCTFDERPIAAVWDELETFLSLESHPNIITFIGYVKQKNPLIVLELAEKTLWHHFKENNYTFEDQKIYSDIDPEKNTVIFKNAIIRDSLDKLCTFDLILFAYQIAKGMEYLASVPCNHRNIALVNILLMRDKTIRLGSFAFSKKHGNNENYKLKISDDKPITQIYHMAPEVLHNLELSEKTDVWSYAVCLFEIFNLGKYTTILNLEEWGNSGKPPSQSTYCPPEIYKLMLRCWTKDPAERPDFSECVDFFSEYLDRHNAQLRQQIDGKLLAVADWQRTVRNRVHRAAQN